MAGHEHPTEPAPVGRHPPRAWEALMAQHARGRGLKVRPATPRDHGRIDVIVRARFPRPAAVLGEAAGIARRRIGIAGPDGRTHSAWLAEDAQGVLRAYLIVSPDDRGDLHIHEVASAPPGPRGRIRHAATVLIGIMLAAVVAKAPEARVSLVSLAEHRWLPGDAALVPPWRDPLAYYETIGLSRLAAGDVRPHLGVAIRPGDIVLSAPVALSLAAIDRLLRPSR